MFFMPGCLLRPPVLYSVLVMPLYGHTDSSVQTEVWDLLGDLERLYSHTSPHHLTTNRHIV